MNGPILFDDYWRIRFLNVGVFRYKLIPMNTNHNNNSVPVVEVQRGTVAGWIGEYREMIHKSIAMAHGWIPEVTT